MVFVYHACFSGASMYASKAASAAQVGTPARAYYHRMNQITVEQQERLLALIREGHSLREIERRTGHRRETIALYGRLAGLLPRKDTRTHVRMAA